MEVLKGPMGPELEEGRWMYQRALSFSTTPRTALVVKCGWEKNTNHHTRTNIWKLFIHKILWKMNSHVPPSPGNNNHQAEFNFQPSIWDVCMDKWLTCSQTHCPGRYAGLVFFHESLCQYFLISHWSHAVTLSPLLWQMTSGNADLGNFWGWGTIRMVAYIYPDCLEDHYPWAFAAQPDRRAQAFN